MTISKRKTQISSNVIRGLHIVLEYKKATLLPWNASLHLLIICTYCLVLVKKCAIEGIANDMTDSIYHCN